MPPLNIVLKYNGEGVLFFLNSKIAMKRRDSLILHFVASYKNMSICIEYAIQKAKAKAKANKRKAG